MKYRYISNLVFSLVCIASIILASRIKDNTLGIDIALFMLVALIGMMYGFNNSLLMDD